MKNLILLMLLFSISITNLIHAHESINEHSGKRKIVFIKDDDGEGFNTFEKVVKELLVQKGWSDENSEFYTFSLKGKQSTKAEILKKIREIKPDVVLINSPHIQDLALKLSDDNIRFVSGGGLELTDKNDEFVLINKNGYPCKNITGTFTMPLDHLKESFARMNDVSPLKGKKVAFATYPQPAFTKEKVKKALQTLNFELKEFKIFEYIEDYKEFIKRNNADPEIGWIVTGEYIVKSRYEKELSVEEICKWERDNIQKPNFGFWPIGVKNGHLYAAAVDSITTVYQMVAMANSLLRGIPIENIKAEDPIGTMHLFNQKRANEIGIKFSDDLLDNADKIFIDYEGNYISKE